jgi:phosphonate metabolism protein PhnN/1,5-bisphosphokinase (PRPP-forming)
MSGGEAKKSPESASASPGWRSGNAALAYGPSLFGGTLILVVGPSASGKDTLLDAAKASFQRDTGLIFARRVITRTDQTGEAHEICSEDEFERIAHEGGFFLAWGAHGLRYGVGADTPDTLKSGRSVVVNASRQIILEARAKWPNTHIINVTANEEVRRARLIGRGRESAEHIDARLKRAGAFDLPAADWITRIDNSGALSDGVAAFVAAIAAIRSGTGSGRRS